MPCMDHQPDAREGRAGPGWESDRPIVVRRRGNARGTKGPELKDQRRKQRGKEGE